MKYIIYLIITILISGCHSSDNDVRTEITRTNDFGIVAFNTGYELIFEPDLNYILERCDNEGGTLNKKAYWEPDQYGMYYRENPSTIICNCAIGTECLILVIPL